MVDRAGQETGDVFDDIEAQAEQMGRETTQELIQARLEVEEARRNEEVPCPECAKPMRRPPKPAERALETASGNVRYRRRHAICDRCRKSFSPAGPSAADSPPGAVKPPST
jgi:hypothetical protein